MLLNPHPLLIDELVREKLRLAAERRLARQATQRPNPQATGWRVSIRPATPRATPADTSC
jgi:hypothetical protein